MTLMKIKKYKKSCVMQVDLSLAINYLPACTCFVKMVLFMTCVISITQGEEIWLFFILSFLLYMDRLIWRNIIFDSNSILLAVFHSNVYRLVRSVAPITNMMITTIICHILWAAFCLTLLVEPQILSRWIDKRNRAYTLFPSLVMITVLSLFTFIREDIETSLTNFCRAIAFNLLCLVWIYLIGVNNTQSIEYLKDNSSQFISRMAPLLYSPIWISGIFCISSMIALLYQYTNLTRKNTSVQEHPPPPQDCVIQVKNDTVDTEQGDLYEIFKMAKQLGKLVPITE